MDLHNVHEALSAHDVDMSKSSFTNASLAASRFDDVSLAGATFTNANLSGMVLDDVNLTGASISKAKLAGMVLDDVNLTGTSISNANLSGTVLDDVNLTGALISNANVTGMRINGILVDDLMRAYRGAAGAVLYAKDLPRLRRFYEKALGFVVETTQRDHAVLVSPALRLTLVEIPAHISSSIEIVDPPRLRSESPTKLVFSTTNIAAVRAIARELGGNVLPPEREWELDAGRRCDGNDPEGNVFQLREEPA
jgi:uncharacterized protein YjbI with pentapeptide repeats